MKKLCVVVINYRGAAMTIDCLRTLAPEMEGHPDRCCVLVDNASGDDSVPVLENAVRAHGWDRWITLVASPINRGFAGGNNIGFTTIQAENYLLLNSDTHVVPGAITTMLEAMEANPQVGALGPRLQDPDGAPQCSCFRYRTPMSEMLEAAGTGPLDRLCGPWLVAMGVFDRPMEPQWLSFACIMVRKAVVDQIGLMDENYFMYFEDIDYSRQIRRAGWRILHVPQARVVHLRGGSSSVKSAMKARKRVPRYYYESRSRYFAKFYGGVAGLWLANLMWLSGRSIAWTRELVGNKERDVCEREGRDNWTNWLRPLRPPAPRPQHGGDL